MSSYRRWYGRTIVANVTDGPAVRGTLWRERGGVLVLRGAAVVVGGQPTPVDGEVVVERAHVAFLQVLP